MTSFYPLHASPGRLLIVVVFLANLLVISLGATTLYQSREQFERRAETQSQNLALAVGQTISGSVAKIDLSLRNAVRQLETAGSGKGLADPALKEFIAFQESLLPEVQGLRVADTAGRVLLGKGVNPVTPPTVVDREYFLHFRDGKDTGLYVSKAFLGRITGKWSLALARAYAGPDGGFGGIVFATITLEHFQGLLSRFDLGQKGVISLRDKDLASLVRHPRSSGDQAMEIGQALVSKEFKEAVRTGATMATFHAVTPYDGVARTLTFHRLENLPLLVVAGLARDDYLQGWWKAAWQTGMFCLAFLLLSLAGLALLGRAFRHLEHESRKNRLILQRASDGIHILDSGGILVEASDAFCAGLGYAKEDILGMHVARWDARWPVEELERTILPEALKRTTPGTFETRHRRKDGTMIDVEVSTVGFDLDGRRFLFASSRDITEQKAVKAALAESEQKLRALFELAPLGIAKTDMDGHYVEFNEAFRQICGYPAEELKTLDYWALTPSSYRQQEEEQLQSLARTGRYGPFEKEYRQKDGRLVPLRLNGMVVTGKDGRQYIWSIVEDITALRESQARMERLAYLDGLTGLPNRTLLADRLKQALANAERHGRSMALCYLDLDGFKPVNDTCGHEVGDLLLVDVARRLQASVRTGETVARLGGDEFVVLLGDASDTHEIEQAVRRLLNTVAIPYRMGSQEAVMTASIGVAVYPGDGQTPDALLRHADQAMYVAKQRGKNRFHFFDAESDRRVHEHTEVVARVEEGLGRGEFRLYYQPKVDMFQGTVVGMEALIRWQHPERGLLSPAAFLPFVENSDCAILMGRWVLEEAMRQMGAWADAGIRMPVSVNISARHLEQRSFVTDLAALLARHSAVPPDWLELEILETTAMEDLEAVSRLVASCSSLGVSFALDDFGTGYSSLTYFRRLPTHLLKIDQSFVREMLDDMDDLAIVEGVIGLARTFQRQIIAEGVETVEHGIPLLHFGCHLAQGYAIARPMPAEAVPRWLADWRVPAEWQAMARTHWDRADFPLLLAEIQHRRWIDRLMAICEGRLPADQVPSLEVRDCRFGQWLYGNGQNRYGHLAAFRALEPLHDRVHALAVELFGLLPDTPEEARMRAPELLGTREALVAGLNCLKACLAMPPVEHAA